MKGKNTGFQTSKVQGFVTLELQQPRQMEKNISICREAKKDVTVYNG